MARILVFALLWAVTMPGISCSPPPHHSQKVTELQKQVKELTTENDRLRREIATLKTKKKASGDKKEEGRYTREEFKKLVMGRTKDQVIAALGRPSSTDETPYLDCWYYRKITYDPISQKVDGIVQLCFTGGVVVSTSF